jgi:acyl-CoA synthetase (AMP-forming)/AMP-acid ligase II
MPVIFNQILVRTHQTFHSKNLFPVQIENAMTSHHAIREAAAVAVPCEQYGEVVGAWIVREPGTYISPEEVRNHVASTMNPQVSYLVSVEYIHF